MAKRGRPPKVKPETDPVLEVITKDEAFFSLMEMAQDKFYGLDRHSSIACADLLGYCAAMIDVILNKAREVKGK